MIFRRPRRLPLFCAATLLLTAGAVAAQEAAPPGPQDSAQAPDSDQGQAQDQSQAPASSPSRPTPCTAPEHRHFDFWLGEWTVTNQQTGASAAVNRIRSAHGGCVVIEDYESGAYSGTSLNFYDAAAGVWRQTWIDNQGQPLRISGGLEDGSMVMRSEPGADGSVQRITWTPRDDGTVRQHWQWTSDGGDSWTTAFDGVYFPKR